MTAFKLSPTEYTLSFINNKRGYKYGLVYPDYYSPETFVTCVRLSTQIGGN
jgi:hypothetical protein